MGNWISLVPKSENLNVQILNSCDEFISEYGLATSEMDTEFDSYQLSGLENNFIELNTGIIDCDGEQDDQAIITIQNPSNSSTYIFQEENPNVWVSTCEEDVSLYASNNNTGESGPVIEWNTNINDDLTLLSNCDDFADGFSYIKIRNDKETFSSFSFEYVAGKTILSSEDDEIRFSFRGSEEGSYEESEVNIFIDDRMFGEDGYYISCENSVIGCGINECIVTHYAENEGDWMRVSFSGTLWMQTINPPVAGNYEIEGLIIAKK